MKKSILLLSTFLLLVAVKHVSAQWEITGNTINGTEWFGASTTSDIPISFEHRANHANSQFRWFTHNGTVDERMRLTRPGWLGINTTAPDMRFHVLDGGILSSGVVGTNPDLGIGTRLLWIPDSAAFRAGRITGADSSDDFWDTPNVGFGSIAMGLDNLALGEAAISLGSLNRVFGLHSVALGYCNNLAADNNYSLGNKNELTEDLAFAVGQHLRSEAINNAIIGIGISSGAMLLNEIENSLMVGFNSTVPTLFVGPSEEQEPLVMLESVTSLHLPKF